MKDEKLRRVRQVVKWLLYNGVAENQKELALAMDYNPTVVSAVLTGHTPLSDKFIRNLCALHPDIDVHWVMCEKLADNPFVAMMNHTAEFPSPPWEQGEHRPLPPVGTPYYSDLPVSGGRVEQFLQDAEPSDFIRIPGVQADFFFPVIGCSMEPTVCQGDIIGVRSIDPAENIYPDKIYMVVTRDNERMIKHIRVLPDNQEALEFFSDNPSFKPFQVPFESIHQLFRVVYVGRRC